MSDALRYDLILETTGILRSRDFRVRLDEDLEPGQTIELSGQLWLVTKVAAAKGNVDIDRRAIAHELPEVAYD
jgi:hypothetical protein